MGSPSRHLVGQNWSRSTTQTSLPSSRPFLDAEHASLSTRLRRQTLSCSLCGLEQTSACGFGSTSSGLCGQTSSGHPRHLQNNARSGSNGKVVLLFLDNLKQKVTQTLGDHLLLHRIGETLFVFGRKRPSGSAFWLHHAETDL